MGKKIYTYRRKPNESAKAYGDRLAAGLAAVEKKSTKLGSKPGPARKQSAPKAKIEEAVQRKVPDPLKQSDDQATKKAAGLRSPSGKRTGAAPTGLEPKASQPAFRAKQRRLDAKGGKPNPSGVTAFQSKTGGKIRSYDPKTGPSKAEKQRNAQAMSGGKPANSAPIPQPSQRKLVMTPKQIKRRAARARKAGRG